MEIIIKHVGKNGSSVAYLRKSVCSVYLEVGLLVH
jgi:hypothetical protein